MLLATIAFALLSVSHSHICFISPQQRGNFSIHGAGSSNCYRRQSECGGIPAGAPTASYAAGSTQNIIVQQNFNHWAQGTPGLVDISVSYNTVNPTDSDFVVLATTDDFPGHEQVLQTNFSFIVKLPKRAAPAVIRARYVSRNPDEQVPNNVNSTFYNCADVLITPAHADNVDTPSILDERKALMHDIHDHNSDLSRRVEHLVARALRDVGAAPAPQQARPTAPLTGCCASDQFALRARRTLRTNNDVSIVDDIIEADQILQLTRSTQVPRGDAAAAFYAISDFQKGVEYFVNMSVQTCALYGPDEWYPFCWGDKAAPGTQRLLTVNSTASYFVNNDMSWIFAVAFVASTNTCLPVLGFSNQAEQPPTFIFMTVLKKKKKKKCLTRHS
jgi:hypothetical protein